MSWTAKWIAAPDTQDKTPEPLFRKAFRIDTGVTSARILASGLGYMELTLDGQRLGDSVLDPAFTRYDKRVQYVTYELGSLSVGDHVIGARLGRGFFGMQGNSLWGWEGAGWHADPRLILQLEINYDDSTRSTIGTDESWLTAEGPTRSDSIYGGETYDAAFEQTGWSEPDFDATSWRMAVVVDASVDVLEPQRPVPIRVVETITPVSANQASNGDWVFDMGRNIAGWARLRVTGAAGTRIVLRYDERLDTNGEVVSADESVKKGFNWFVYGRFQTDIYLLAGRRTTESWEPRYSYKGFRFVQVCGWPGTPTVNDLDGRVVHSDVSTVGSFSCSNDLFNAAHLMVRRTVLNNLHGIPTDTPAFEKDGWMGDSQLMAEGNLFNIDIADLYVKWLDDIRDSQRAADDQHLPSALSVIAPDYGWSFTFDAYYQSPPWCAAYVLIPWWLHLYTARTQVLTDHFDTMKGYLDNQIQPGINFSSLTDYMSPGNYGNSPEDAGIYGTAYAYLMTKTLISIAGVLGKDTTSLAAKATAIMNAFNAAYFDQFNSLYPKNQAYRQTPNVLALAFGLVPSGDEDTVFKNLVGDLEKNGLNTGTLGTKYLLTELTKRGEGELAYAIATQRDYPGWGSWIDRGATTCWEYWDDPNKPDVPSRSLDHAFLGGTIDEWFFKCLVGIEPLTRGFARMQIKPWFIGGLTEVSGEVPTPNGTVTVHWARSDDCSTTLDVSVPPRSKASVYLQASDLTAVTVNGQSADATPGVSFSGSQDGRQVFEVDAGSYSFQVLAGAAPCRATRLHLVAAFNASRSLMHAEHDDAKEATIGWFPREDLSKKPSVPPVVNVVATSASTNGDVHVCVSDPVTKKVWHTIRYADKRWQTFWGDVQSQEPDGPDITGRASAVACAANVDGDLHICAVADTGSQLYSGELWHTMRFAEGQWQARWGHVQPDGQSSPIEPISAVACGINSDGDLHVCVVGADGTLYHTIRFANGNWQPFWGPIQSEEPEGPAIGAVSRVACAVTDNGDLHVCIVSRSGHLWHTIRFASGDWQPLWGDLAAALAGEGFSPPAAEVACAASFRSGNLHVCVTDQSGSVWYTRRATDGVWTNLTALGTLSLTGVTRLGLCDALVG